MTSAKLQTEVAEILIKPDLSSFNKVDINQAPALIDVGHKTALQVLEKWRDDA